MAHQSAIGSCAISKAAQVSWWSFIAGALAGAIPGAIVMFIFLAEQLSFWVESYERDMWYEVTRDDWARRT
jgi:uncharacterized membrane protein